MNKEAKCGIYMYTMEYFSALKKEILSQTTTRMNFENIMLVSQLQKDKYYVIPLT